MQSHRFLWALSVAAASCTLGQGAFAQAFADRKASAVDYSRADLKPRQSCEAMARYKNKDLVEIHAAHLAATDNSPAFCLVTGVMRPEVAFEVALPDSWNGRFYMIGNGGFAGNSMEDPGRAAQRNEALAIGFAFAMTNTGHDSRKEPGGSFVMSNPQKAIDYAYRAVNVTALTGKDITRRYFGKPVSYAYWNSCSNGGRQGLIEAQRYPKDFNGVVANAPWVSQTGFSVGAMWNQKALSAAPLTAAKLALVAEKVMARCDAIDGLKDNLIDDPRRCSFDARTDVPACAAGTDDASCLTSAQADAIMKVYGGPISNGRKFFPGFMFGSEAVVPPRAGNPAASSWMGLIAAAQPGTKPADFNLAEGLIRFMAHKPPQPEYDYQSFQYDKDIPMLDAWGKLANADNPDLSRFRRNGGRLLMSYGWADTILQPMMGVNYYEQAVARNGAGTTDFFRLFMVPGMAHCAGGNGTDRFDPMTAIINWVEQGKAPDSIRAAHVQNNQEVRSRPLCPYPKVARYSGTGSIDDAVNFSCANP